MATKQPAPADDDGDAGVRDVRDAVDTTAAGITYLESHTVGAKAGRTGTSPDAPESVGHRSGRRIVKLLGKNRDALIARDHGDMRKVVGHESAISRSVRRARTTEPAAGDIR